MKVKHIAADVAAEQVGAARRLYVLDAEFTIEYGPVRKPWGFTRSYIRDPFGRLVNIVAHD